jgi:hypothetical protein
MIKLIYITNDYKICDFLENIGINRIFLDLEFEGKVSRQGHLNTFISDHKISDIQIIKNKINKTDLLVRVNPLSNNSLNEINKVIKLGATHIMMPMIKGHEDVKELVNIVSNRCKIIPLLETIKSIENIDRILSVDGLSEIYFGLNDLHIELNKKFIFQPLTEGYLDKSIMSCKKNNISFGIGGLAPMNDGIISGEIVLGEYLYQGSSSVILSRSFRSFDFKDDEDFRNILKSKVHDIRKKENQLNLRNDLKKEMDHLDFINKVNDIVRG